MQHDDLTARVERLETRNRRLSMCLMGLVFLGVVGMLLGQTAPRPVPVESAYQVSGYAGAKHDSAFIISTTGNLYHAVLSTTDNSVTYRMLPNPNSDKAHSVRLNSK